MPAEYSRSDRIAEQIQRELARIIQQGELKDTNIATIVTISAVKVTRDLSYAKVYISVLDEAQLDMTLKTLNKAAGFLRTMIAKVIKARTVPQLKFVFDSSIIEGDRLSKLIDDLNQDIDQSA